MLSGKFSSNCLLNSRAATFLSQRQYKTMN